MELISKKQLKAIRNKHGKTVNPVNVFVLDVARRSEGNRTSMLIGNVSEKDIEIHDLFVFKQNMYFQEQAKIIYNLYVEHKPEYILLGEQGLSAGLVDVLINDFGFGVLNKNDDRNDDRRVLYVTKDYTERSNYITSFLSMLGNNKISLQKELIPNVISNCTDLLCEQLDSLNICSNQNGKLSLEKSRKDDDCGLTICLLKLCWFANNYNELLKHTKAIKEEIVKDYIKLKQSDAWIHRNAILELECDSEGCLVVVTHTHVYEEKYHSLSELNNEYDRIKDFLGVK